MLDDIDIGAAASRWKDVWEQAQEELSHLTPHQRLVLALGVFIRDELEAYEGHLDKKLILAQLLASASQSGTHSKASLQAAASDLLGQQKKTGNPIKSAFHSTSIRAITAGSLVWILGVQSWGFIFRWGSIFGDEEWLALNVLPPILATISFILWRWVRRGQRLSPRK